MFSISELMVGSGHIGICPLPGRFSTYQADLKAILDWKPNLAITLTTLGELERAGVLQFPEICETRKSIGHIFGRRLWCACGRAAGLDRYFKPGSCYFRVGGRVLTHCYGCGRSGMRFCV